MKTLKVGLVKSLCILIVFINNTKHLDKNKDKKQRLERIKGEHRIQAKMREKQKYKIMDNPVSYYTYSKGIFILEPVYGLP